LAPFDLRPAGYGVAEAQAFLATLSPEGRGFYLDGQHRVDSVCPALLAATIGFALYLLAPGHGSNEGPGWLRWALALLAVPGSVFDHLENHAVAAMLRAGAGGISAPLAATASLRTVLKSGFSTLMMLALLALIGYRLARRRRRRL